jgi:hypothetical protein
MTDFLQSAPFPTQLEELVKACSYRPGWTVRLSDIDRGQGFKRPDADHHDEGVRHLSPRGWPALSRQSLHAGAASCLIPVRLGRDCPCARGTFFAESTLHLLHMIAFAESRKVKKLC